MPRAAKYILSFLVAVALGLVLQWGFVMDSMAPLDEGQSAQVSDHQGDTAAAVLQGGPDGVEARTPVQETVVEPAPVIQAPALNGDLQVLVVDAAGQPVAQIPVELVRGSTRLKGKYNSKAKAVSGVGGLATLAGTAKQLEEVFDPDRKPAFWEAQGFRLGVRAKLPFDIAPGADPDQGVVWLTENPTQPVRLTIPPIGWVEVEMRPAHEGQGPNILPSWVLVRRGEEEHTGGWRMGHAVEEPEQPLLLGPFGLGWQLTINLSRRDRMGPLAFLELAGPTRSGEVLKVSMNMAETQFIEGVAVNASGQPFVDCKLSIVLCRLGKESGALTYPTTDSKGRWRFEVAPEMPGTSLKVRVHRDPREFRGELPSIQRPSGAGRLDVGQVVLHPGKGEEQLLVSGRVVDEAGRPVRRAHVSVYAILDVDGKDIRAERALATTRTRSDGLFELSTYDRVESGRVRVFASGKEYLTPPVQDVPVGTLALQFGLARGGGIGAMFRIEHSIPKDQVVIRLKGEGRSRKLSLIEFAWREKSCFSSLRQGDYGIRIEIRSTDWLLYESRAQVQSGQAMTLGEIDLRGKTQLLKLHLVDTAGQELSKKSFGLIDSQGMGYRNGLKTNEDGNIWCVIPTGTGRLRLGSREFGEVEIMPASGTIEVVFSK